jgi:hypothetical protein
VAPVVGCGEDYDLTPMATIFWRDESRSAGGAGEAGAVQVFPAKEDELPNPEIVVQRDNTVSNGNEKRTGHNILEFFIYGADIAVSADSRVH